MFHWDDFKCSVPWLKERTIYLTKHGSHAYGTNIESSDLDIRGVCIAPAEYYTGFSKVFEQMEAKTPDITVFDIRKFFKLAADGNPNALEIIFTDPSDHILLSGVGHLLIVNRDGFLSKKIKHTFMGYAHSQFKRIDTHRRWLLNPILEKPSRADFGLAEKSDISKEQYLAVESAIKKRLDEWEWQELDNLDESARIAVKNDFTKKLTMLTGWNENLFEQKKWKTAAKSIGIETNMIELLDKERRYLSKIKDWENYKTWVKTRNPVRAVMEEKFGYDGKHGLHLVRLAKMCLEVLETGKMNVKRNDAADLLKIRYGEWSYEKLLEWFNEINIRIEEAYAKSSLPRCPNYEKLDKLCSEMIESYNFGHNRC